MQLLPICLVIVDDYGEITDNMKAMIWETVETKYPNVDFSDFTFVYEPEHRLINYNKGWYFHIYYKNILLHGFGDLNTSSNVYAAIVETANKIRTVDLEMVIDPTLYTKVNLDEQCISKEDIKTILKEDVKLISEPEKIIYIDFQDKYSLKLAYRAINANEDGEYIIDAVTGGIIEYISYYVI